MLRRVLLLIFAMLLPALSLAAQTAAPQPAEAAIQQLLHMQVEAWNHHDLEGFMGGYWHSPELTFFSGGSETKGWEPTLARYRRRYQANGAEMGTLTFTDLNIAVLGPDAAFVRGQFHLAMPDGKHPQGLFTLVLKRLPEGWRIAHDHSSAAGE